MNSSLLFFLYMDYLYCPLIIFTSKFYCYFGGIQLGI